MKLQLSRAAAALAATTVVLASAIAGLAPAASAAPAAPHVDLAALAAAVPIPASQAVAQFEAGKAAAKAAGRAASDECRSVYFKSGRFYVSAEFGWDGHGGGMLRARSETLGPWEIFEMCPYDGYWLIASLGDPQPGRVPYVATEKEYSGDDKGMLRARSEAIGTWEQYTVVTGPDWVALKARANDRYVSVERQWTGDRFGMLRARSATIGPWEKFTD
jgi:hypothetical protein